MGVGLPLIPLPGFVYTSLPPQPPAPPPPNGSYAVLLPEIIERYLVLPGLPFERQDLVTGVRVYRLPAAFAYRLLADCHGQYVAVFNVKYYFGPTDPSVGFEVIRAWTPLL